MNKKLSIRSIFWAAALFLPVACGPGETPRAESAAALRATPAPNGETLQRYREKGIEPRKARFSRQWEE